MVVRASAHAVPPAALVIRHTLPAQHQQREEPKIRALSSQFTGTSRTVESPADRLPRFAHATSPLSSSQHRQPTSQL